MSNTYDRNYNRSKNSRYVNISRDFKRGDVQRAQRALHNYGDYSAGALAYRGRINGLYELPAARPIASRSAADGGKRRNSSGKPRRKWLKIAAVSFAVLLLVIVGAVLATVYGVLGQIDFMSGDDLLIPEDLDSIVIEDDDVISASDTIDSDKMEQVDNSIRESMVDKDGLRYEDGVTNILVLGVDSRTKKTSTTARSDAIMLVSINENSKKIVISSIMRDVYVAIPGRSGNDKLNAANAYGGPALAVETVEGAFGIKIDKFVMVNFYAFMDAVDALGGVDVEINSGEKKHINFYIDEINGYLGYPENDGLLYETGDSVHLTGKQAMGYVRVRYSGNGDYERTERQREVLEQIINKARQADYATLLNIINKVADNISTDYSITEITELALHAADYISYDISQIRIPAEGTYWGGVYRGTWILDIDFDANRKLLYETVFDNYEG